jgi:hypothetical protein
MMETNLEVVRVKSKEEVHRPTRPGTSLSKSHKETILLEDT